MKGHNWEMVPATKLNVWLPVQAGATSCCIHCVLSSCPILWQYCISSPTPHIVVTRHLVACTVSCHQVPSRCLCCILSPALHLVARTAHRCDEASRCPHCILSSCRISLPAFHLIPHRCPCCIFLPCAILLSRAILLPGQYLIACTAHHRDEASHCPQKLVTPTSKIQGKVL